MKKLFIESNSFAVRRAKHLGDEGLYRLQNQLMSHPDAGTLIKGCGGLRKLRTRSSRTQRGKWGGLRVIYLHIPETNWIFFLDVYGKEEKDDLSAKQKKLLASLAEQMKNEAIASIRRTS